MDELVTDNQPRKRFEIFASGHYAFLDYIIKHDNIIYLAHTEVPPELEGKGYGKKLVAHAIGFAQEKNYKIVPACSFVDVYFRRHPELSPLLAKR